MSLGLELLGLKVGKVSVLVSTNSIRKWLYKCSLSFLSVSSKLSLNSLMTPYFMHVQEEQAAEKEEDSILLGVTADRKR